MNSKCFCSARFNMLLPGLAALCMALSPAPAAAQGSSETEAQIKAGFIYNFALFVQWPDGAFKSSSAPLEIGLAGNSGLLAAFDPLNTKKIKDRPVAVFFYEDNATRRCCHIVYIPAADPGAAAQLLKKISGPGVLTIGDAENFARIGGIIGFYREGNKLRFEINTEAAHRAGLKLSSQLLKLAKIVSGSDAQ